MVDRRVLGGFAVGLGVGLGGSLLVLTGGKPQISITGTGASTVWTFSGFPPNVPLMSMGGGTGGIGSAPTNIGQTDANGVLVMTGAPAIPAGNTVLYTVFVATNPTIYAVAVIQS